MAYDEALAARIRDLITPRSDVTERKMFGGIAWMLGGNMALGVLGEPDTRVFDMTGRPAPGMVVVAGPAVAGDARREAHEREDDVLDALAHVGLSLIHI